MQCSCAPGVAVCRPLASCLEPNLQFLQGGRPKRREEGQGWWPFCLDPMGCTWAWIHGWLWLGQEGGVKAEHLQSPTSFASICFSGRECGILPHLWPSFFDGFSPIECQDDFWLDMHQPPHHEPLQACSTCLEVLLGDPLQPLRGSIQRLFDHRCPYRWRHPVRGHGLRATRRSLGLPAAPSPIGT